MSSTAIPRTEASHVSVVAFDVGMTLLRAEPSYAHVFARGCERAGVEVDTETIRDLGSTFPSIWREHDEAWKAHGGLSPHIGDVQVERDFWTGLYRRVLEVLDVEGDHAQVASCVFEAFLEPDAFGPFDDVPGALDELEDHDVTLAVLSNWGTNLRAMLEGHGYTDRFDVIVISGEERVAKPDPEIFHRLLERLDEPPGPHVAYVGDDLHHDVVPAERLGLTTVLVDRYDRHPDHEGLRVEDLRAVPGALGLRDE